MTGASSSAACSTAWLAIVGLLPLTSSDITPCVCRAALCGNGICEIGERTVEGAVDGSCPQDCSFETKVGLAQGCVGEWVMWAD